MNPGHSFQRHVRPMGPWKHRAQGIALFEALIGAIVLAVGLFGVGLLQVNALRESRNAFSRGQAVLLATAMADRIRSNPAGSLAGAYGDGKYTYTTALQASRTVAPGVMTAAERATNDLATWRTDVDRQLGKGQAAGIVYPVAAQKGAWSILIVWPEKQASSGRTPSTTCPTSIGAPESMRCTQMMVMP